jgi:protein-disulfide isomerase
MTNRLSNLLVMIVAIAATAMITQWVVQKNAGQGAANIDEAKVRAIVENILKEKSVKTTSSPVDDAKVKELIELYLKEHSELVFRAAIAGSQKEKLLKAQAARKNIVLKKDELEKDPGTPTIGPADADVTIVAFSDYNCGYCRRMVPVFKALLKEDKKVRFVSKDFPILSQASQVAAMAGMAIFTLDKEKYLPFHFELLSTSARSPQSILAAATKVGIDIKSLNEEMKKPKYRKQMIANVKLGESIGVSGTPAIIINGELIPGAISLEELKKKISEAREKKS